MEIRNFEYSIAIIIKHNKQKEHFFKIEYLDKVFFDNENKDIRDKFHDELNAYLSNKLKNFYIELTNKDLSKL
jgi:hypothetical protein